MHVEKVGARSLRENLSAYLEGDKPIAVTRHGETIGLYIPVRRRRPEDVEAYKMAAEQIQALLQGQGVSEAELIADLEALKAEDALFRQA